MTKTRRSLPMLTSRLPSWGALPSLLACALALGLSSAHPRADPGCAAGAGEPGARRPNVVVVVLDQVRADMLGCYGNTFCATPSIDSIAAGGTTFTRAYVPFSQCSPSRASLMTGLEPHKTGIAIQPRAEQLTDERLRRDVPSLGSAFKAAGYATAYFGKWHLSPPDKEQQEVTTYGYDLFVKGPGLAKDVVPFRYQEESAPYLTGPLAGECSRDGPWSERIVERAIAYVDQRCRNEPDEPFLLVYSDQRPHPPYLVPADVLERLGPKDVPLWPNTHDDLSGRPESVRRMRAAMIGPGTPSDAYWRDVLRHYSALLSAADEQIGRLLECLERNGIEKDTLVVFVSDHGDTVGAHGFFSKNALSFEELVRIPLVIRWPGHVRAGARSDALVGIQDVFPTLVALTGLQVDVSAMDGASLVPFLDGKEPARWREYYHSWHEGNVYGKLTLDVLIGRRFKYAFSPYAGAELYDLQADPWELQNLVGDEAHLDIAASMHAFLREKILADKYRSYAMPVFSR